MEKLFKLFIKKINYLLIFGLSSLLLLVNSCKKEEKPESLLSSAKKWYMGSNAKETSVLKSNKGIILKVEQVIQWDEARAHKLDDGTEIVSVPMSIKMAQGNAQGSYMLLISRAGESFKSQIAYNEKGNYFKAGFSTAEIGQLYKSLNKISLNGKSLSVNRNGELMSDEGGGGMSDEPQCTYWYLVETFWYSDGTIAYTTETYLYKTCSSTNGDGTGNGSGTGVVDCAGVVNGTAYRSTDCKTCMGGTTGITECPPAIETKQDSLQKYYPCMVKEVLNKLLANSSYGKLIQPFQSVYVPGIGNVNFKGLPELTFGFSSQTWGPNNKYSLGETEYINTSWNSTINFNTFAMANASQLFLQVTAIHELGHAYTHYYIKNGQYNIAPPIGEGLTWSMGIINYGALLDGEMQMGNFIDHSILLNNYFEKTVEILKSINGNAYTDNEYRMAALYGMDNAGDRPNDPLLTNYNGIDLFNIYKNTLQQTYNNILTKYNITSVELNTFNRNNLINTPIANRLPNNCP
ncbi:hypothetical protein [Pedobacter boryungensis]|uniref:Uncharacterized protein n=1 Tax=Pedobacter boryungensis TaxID=869962 RepID=A0ABX2DCS4_9SPHI|nr:hypothetical protein [Pedobacter boryungensis]NQX31893.1 hypothetical protein [Pedobacter boryungensis]